MSGHDYVLGRIVDIFYSSCRAFEPSMRGGIYCDSCDLALPERSIVVINGGLGSKRIGEILENKLRDHLYAIDTALVQFMSASGATAESLAGHMPPIIVTVQHLEALRKLNAYHAANVAAVRLG
ncbi:MAG: hypothetical protein KDJ26_08015 [Alphaproteobacteria bacterium]|nr:hypothetical protein [Alphaproteobacteria bacterium]MCB9985055.1 hypothetical protein [Micavibrio sp.]